MTQLDDMILVAYADGELDAGAARGVEEAMAQDPQVQARIEIFRATARCVRETFEAPAQKSEPPRMIETLNRLKAPPAKPRWRRFALPLAASLAGVAVGLGGGYGTGYFHAQVQYQVLDTEDHWLDEVVGYYQVYAQDQRLVELGAEETPYIESWFGERLERDFNVPDLSRRGFSFRGARLMALEAQPSSLLVYDSPDGQTLAVCVTRAWDEHEVPPGLHRRAGMNLLYWSHGGYAYILMGVAGEDLLRRVAVDVAAQLEPA